MCRNSNGRYLARCQNSRWATFLKAHWGAIAAMDFFRIEVMTLTGPVRYSVLVVMDLKTRHVVEVAGVVCEAYEKWMLQVLRNLTDAVDGLLFGKTYVIMDRRYCQELCMTPLLRRQLS